MPKTESFIANSVKIHPYKESPKLPKRRCMSPTITTTPSTVSISKSSKAAGFLDPLLQTPQHALFLSNYTVHSLLRDLYATTDQGDGKARELPIANECDSLNDFIEFTASRKVSAVPVKNDEGIITGLVDILDLVIHVADFFLDLETAALDDFDSIAYRCREGFERTKLKDIMKTSSTTPSISPIEWVNQLHTIESNASVLDLMLILSRPEVHRIAVVERKLTTNIEGFFSNSSHSINLKDITEVLKSSIAVSNILGNGTTHPSKPPVSTSTTSTPSSTTSKQHRIACNQLPYICDCQHHKLFNVEFSNTTNGTSNGFAVPPVPSTHNTSVVGILSRVEVARFLVNHLHKLGTVIHQKIPGLPSVCAAPSFAPSTPIITSSSSTSASTAPTDPHPSAQTPSSFASFDKRLMLVSAFTNVWEKQLSGLAQPHGANNADKFFLWMAQIASAELGGLDGFTLPKDCTVEQFLQYVARQRCPCAYVSDDDEGDGREGLSSDGNVIDALKAGDSPSGWGQNKNLIPIPTHHIFRLFTQQNQFQKKNLVLGCNREQIV